MKGDLISRQRAIKTLTNILEYTHQEMSYEKEKVFNAALRCAIQVIQQMPTEKGE